MIKNRKISKYWLNVLIGEGRPILVVCNAMAQFKTLANQDSRNSSESITCSPKFCLLDFTINLKKCFWVSWVFSLGLVRCHTIKMILRQTMVQIRQCAIVKKAQINWLDRDWKWSVMISEGGTALKKTNGM